MRVKFIPLMTLLSIVFTINILHIVDVEVLVSNVPLDGAKTGILPNI